MRESIKENNDIWSFFKMYNSAGVCGILLLMRPLLTLIFSRRRDLNAYSSVDMSALVFILYSIVAFYYAYKTLKDSDTGLGNCVLTKSPLSWFLGYTAICAISTIWSVEPTLTAFRTFECLSMTLLIVATIQYLVENYDLNFLFRWSLFYCTITVLLEIIIILKWARTFSDFREASQMTSTTFFFMALYLVPRRWYNYLILFMSVISMSTVAYIGMAFGFVCILWTNKKLQNFAIVLTLCVSIAVMLMGPEKILKDTLFFDKEDVSLSSTNGRDKLMDVTIQTVEEYPLGLGFFSAEPYIFYAHHLHAISAHNSLFSAALGTGIIGLLVLCIFFLKTGLLLLKRTRFGAFYPILLGCFCVAILHCMGNPSVGTRVYPYGAWMSGMYIFTLIFTIYVCTTYYEIDNEDKNSDEYDELID
ncbi:MAG: O-antigen ligase family protein [Muribaculum sp.]|nr:O-antigen ligase family protein [Muribaculum sp.]